MWHCRSTNPPDSLAAPIKGQPDIKGACDGHHMSCCLSHAVLICLRILFSLIHLQYSRLLKYTPMSSLVVSARFGWGVDKFFEYWTAASFIISLLKLVGAELGSIKIPWMGIQWERNVFCESIWRNGESDHEYCQNPRMATTTSNLSASRCWWHT